MGIEAVYQIDAARDMVSDLMNKGQRQEDRIKELERKLEDCCAALNSVQLELRELQPCGHPVACIRVGEQAGPGEYVHVCAWCESLDVARWQERQMQYRLFRAQAQAELARIEQHGGTTAFARRVLALAEDSGQ